MTQDKTEYIWLNGKLLPWEQATVHVTAHALHYGSTVFEGIRVYEIKEQPHIFCLEAHVKRLFASGKIFRMDISYTPEEIKQAISDTVKANRVKSCYIRPLVFRGESRLGVNPLPGPVDVSIIAVKWGRYLGPEAIEQGVDVGVSSWRRLAPATSPAAAKIGGQYVNSQFIAMEAAERGYAEGIALDINGFISEGSGENVFVVRDGVIYTPPPYASILQGVTRACIITLAHDLGYVVKEEPLPREMLYIADEVFFTGTAAEVTPIRSVDHIPVGSGKRGPITERLQTEFFGIIGGEVQDRHGWLTPVVS
ncbi:MAG TPA: branched-chain amino acid transaminase [Anaerolineae bacterium]|nr:branched-chain amino acid transaminase [Anaerolineae bacterium]HQH39039.1 branched-chain amino acid transaminase [Anaerolineae bacterium]